MTFFDLLFFSQAPFFLLFFFFFPRSPLSEIFICAIFTDPFSVQGSPTYAKLSRFTLDQTHLLFLIFPLGTVGFSRWSFAYPITPARFFPVHSVTAYRQLVSFCFAQNLPTPLWQD